MSNPIRFDHFMADALYGKNGYYLRGKKIFSQRGDFTTSPKLSPLFARSIIHWIRDAWAYYGKKLPIIEVGPGDGSLAEAIRKNFPLLQRPSLSYHLVEKSKTLRHDQQTLLGNTCTWHHTLSQAISKNNGQALIISNELIDAFPVRIFQKQNNTWLELHLHKTTEHWLPPQSLPHSTLFQHQWPDQQRIEIPESAHHFLTEQLAPLQKGDLLTIDYGGTAEEIYHRRPQGSLRAYLLQNLLNPPEAYQNPGRQDLTFDVCFDDLIHWTHPLGIEPIAYLSQRDFLLPLATETLQDTYLTHPEGPGHAFRVLHQRKW